MSNIDENRLILLLKAKDASALQMLIRQYQGRVYKIAYGITLDREESRDIVQEVFLKAYENIHTFKEASKISTWIQRITINHCLNWKRTWKRRLRWRHHSIEDEESHYPEPGSNEENPENLYRKKELEKVIQEGLKELPEDARTVFVLRELEGLSYDDIAHTLNIKRGTVSSRLYYARDRLRQFLAKHGWDENHE